MAAGFDGSGNFFRARKWVDDDAQGLGILSDLHDQEDDNFAGAFNKTFCRDGQAAATGDFDMDSHRLTNVGTATTDGDAVNLGQLTGSGADLPPAYKKPVEIAGANLDGRLNFSGATGAATPAGTGINGVGIAFKAADLSWLGKGPEASRTRGRLVMNSNYLGTGGNAADVLIIDEAGWINGPGMTINLAIDETGAWRTISPGTGTQFNLNTAGFTVSNVDTATVTDPYLLAPLRATLTYSYATGDPIFALYKKATGDAAQIRSYTGNGATGLRWIMTLGDTTTEPATVGSYVGSNFALTAYNHEGGGGVPRMNINRSDGRVTFYGDVVSSQSFISSGTTAILATSSANGSIYFRPNGELSASEQMLLATDGSLQLYNGAAGQSLSTITGILAGAGLREKGGKTGAYGSQWINFSYSSGSVMVVYVDNAGYTFTITASDYRIKQQVRPLTDSWNAIKALRPVSYQFADWGEYKLADGKERWGFIAHETQEVLATMATGDKDQESLAQSLDLAPILAATVAALQDAMARIEALEARLPA